MQQEFPYSLLYYSNSNSVYRFLDKQLQVQPEHVCVCLSKVKG